MQKILGYMRKAIQLYGLITDGDHICVGVSGGKDSLVMLKGLVLLKRFIGIDYKITALTIDPQFKGIEGNYSDVTELCKKLGVDYHVVRTQIGEIVFDVRKEENPCSLCARMRRGALYNSAEKLGCNKIALGHNYDDVVETFIMNLFTEGRIGCFSPATYLEDRDIHIIRPLVLAPERAVKKASHNLTIVKSQCPADGHTNRQKTKEFIAEMERKEHGFKDRIFGAMQRADIDGWGIT
ncbi:MAG: tRNA 2-thiocytidine biosynthesis TtcA family protein [Ruminococcus sp.]|nr:tRNA 2-thiocytidine biosynthesis TtcA family protein [Ruminococcus sp.]MDE6679186.1 tRNA 2-thiocytidine biosynthesis TtcA family protein [Ruminococcus sp.]